MKFSILSLFLLAALTFSACQKGDISKDDIVKDDFIKEDDGKTDEKDCFELVYPVTYTMPDGSTISGNEEQLKMAMKAWYEAHPDSKAEAVLLYPVKIAYGDKIKTINNEEAMILAKKDCEGGKVDCFKLVYPVTYTMPDGSTISGNEEQLNIAMKAWYEAHPDSKAEAVLLYPVKIAYGDKIKTINNEEAMILAKKDCEGDKDEVKFCDWDGSKVADPAVWEEHIVEPLVMDEDCGGCIVSGIVKYVKINTDFAYVVYYGKGECDGWAWLVSYYGGSDKKELKCKIKLDCDPGN